MVAVLGILDPLLTGQEGREPPLDLRRHGLVLHQRRELVGEQVDRVVSQA